MRETITLYLVGIVAFIVGATVLHFMEWDSVLFYSIALGGIAGFDVFWGRARAKKGKDPAWWLASWLRPSCACSSRCSASPPGTAPSSPGETPYENHSAPREEDR